MVHVSLRIEKEALRLKAEKEKRLNGLKQKKDREGGEI